MPSYFRNFLVIASLVHGFHSTSSSLQVSQANIESPPLATYTRNTPVTIYVPSSSTFSNKFGPSKSNSARALAPTTHCNSTATRTHHRKSHTCTCYTTVSDPQSGLPDDDDDVDCVVVTVKANTCIHFSSAGSPENDGDCVVDAMKTKETRFKALLLWKRSHLPTTATLDPINPKAYHEPTSSTTQYNKTLPIQTWTIHTDSNGLGGTVKTSEGEFATQASKRSPQRPPVTAISDSTSSEVHLALSTTPALSTSYTSSTSSTTHRVSWAGPSTTRTWETSTSSTLWSESGWNHGTLKTSVSGFKALGKTERLSPSSTIISDYHDSTMTTA